MSRATSAASAGWPEFRTRTTPSLHLHRTATRLPTDHVSDDAWGFALPPFQPEEALQRLKRDLKDLGLAERAGVFERRGVAIARASVAQGHLDAAAVRKPSRNSPEWQARTLKTSADVRDFTQHLKKQLAQWSDTDD